MKRIRTALLFTLITLSLTVMPLFAEEEQAPSPSDGSYHLEQVVVLSRHNIRAPSPIPVPPSGSSRHIPGRNGQRRTVN